MVQSQKPVVPKDLPKEDPAERTRSFVLSHPLGEQDIPESSAASIYLLASARQAWSAEETVLIKEAVAHLDKVPTHSEIRSIFGSSIRLEQILRSNSFDCVRSKVHNLFKKKYH